MDVSITRRPVRSLPQWEDYGGEEIIRIISARAAEKHEIRRCQEPGVD
jgi:hypothetical protein